MGNDRTVQQTPDSGGGSGRDAALTLARVLEAPLGEGDVGKVAEALVAGLAGDDAQVVARLLQRLSILMEVHRVIGATLELDSLLPRLIEAIAALLDADRGTLFLHDKASDELFSRVLQGGQVAEIRIPSHAGIAGHVFTSGETANIPDAYADPRFNQEVDKRTGYRTRSILCMPLLNRDRQVIGVTQLLNRIEFGFGFLFLLHHESIFLLFLFAVTKLCLLQGLFS